VTRRGFLLPCPKRLGPINVGYMGLLSLIAAPVMADKLAEEDLTGLSMEQLLNVEVINASRLGQKEHLAPTSISVVTAREIHTFGWRTLGDALNGIRSLFYTTDRNYNYLGVRGFIHTGDYNSRVLLMIDGKRMNENIYDGAYIGQEFMLDMDLVERIEFIPGSGASIYGANAYTGMINVVTKNAQAVDGAQLAGEIGTFDAYKGRATVGKVLQNGAELLLSASHYGSSGPENLYFREFDTPSTNSGIAHNMDAERADRLFGKAKYGNLTLAGGYVDRYKRVPTAAFGTLFNDPGFYTDDIQFYTDLVYQNKLTNESTLLLRGFYQGYDYRSDLPYAGDNRRIVNRDQVSGRWWGGEAQFTTTAIDRHRLMMGIEYQYDQRQHQTNFDKDPFLLYFDSDRSGHRVELYVQDEIAIRDDLLFNAGLRMDYHHMVNSMQLNPRLGLIWNPLDSTTVKILYSTTFRAPNAYESDLTGFGIVPNPNLKEERIRTYEGILEWRDGEGLKVLGNFFYNEMTQVLETEPLNEQELSFSNHGAFTTYGVELETEKRWESGRLLKAAYTYNLMTDEAHGGNWAVASPQNLFKLHYAEPLFRDKAMLGIENIFIDQRKTLQGSKTEPYYLVNVNLSSDTVIPGLDLSFGVYNLFDNRYQMVGGDDSDNDLRQDILKMNGREFRFKAVFEF
jgi:outer membrane receptor for ferrienterochelin and colicins